MPIHQPYLSHRNPIGKSLVLPDGSTRIHCPKPIVSIPVLQRLQSEFGYYPRSFIVDTGADVTLIPQALAARHKFVGYDPAAAPMEKTTSFEGRLNGRWGSFTIEIEPTVSMKLPCFYYSPSTGDGWWSSWFSRIKRGAHRHPSEYGLDIAPLVFGRGRYTSQRLNFLVEPDYTAISHISFR